MTLDRAIPSPVMPILLSRSAQVGENGFVFGFGNTEQGPNIQLSLDALQGGTTTIRELTSNHLFVLFDGSGVNVCNGDSGGPLVVEVNGQPAIAGIISQGNVPGCLPGDVTTFTNLQSDSVLPWLATVAGDALIR